MNSTIKFFLSLVIILILAYNSKASSRPSTQQRMKSGNSNGFTMKSWYGGNNRHHCKSMRKAKRGNLLRY